VEEEIKNKKINKIKDVNCTKENPIEKSMGLGCFRRSKKKQINK